MELEKLSYLVSNNYFRNARRLAGADGKIKPVVFAIFAQLHFAVPTRSSEQSRAKKSLAFEFFFSR